MGVQSNDMPNHEKIMARVTGAPVVPVADPVVPSHSNILKKALKTAAPLIPTAAPFALDFASKAIKMFAPEQSLTETIIKKVPSYASNLFKKLEDRAKETEAMPMGQAFKRQFIEEPAGILKFLGQGLLSSASSIGQSVLETVYGKDEVRASFAEKAPADKRLNEILYGGQPESWQATKEKIDAYVAQAPESTAFEKRNLGTILAVAGFASDIWPGKPSAKKLASELLEDLARDASEASVRAKMLAAGIPDPVIEIAAPKVALAKTPEEVNRVIQFEAKRAADAVSGKEISDAAADVKIEDVQTKPQLFQQSRSFENLEGGGYETFKVDEIMKDFDEKRLVDNPISVGQFDDGFTVTSGHNRLEILRRAKSEGRLTQPDSAYMKMTDYRGPGGVGRAVKESVESNIASKSVKDINLLDLYIRGTIDEKSLKNALAFDQKKIKFFTEIAETFKRNNLGDFWKSSVGTKLADLKSVDFGVMQERLNFVNRIAKEVASVTKDLTPEQAIAVQNQVGKKIAEFMNTSKVATLKSVESNIRNVLETIRTGGFKNEAMTNLFGETVVETAVQARSGAVVLRKQIENALRNPVVADAQKKRLRTFLRSMSTGDERVLRYVNENTGLTANAEKTQKILKEISSPKFSMQEVLDSARKFSDNYVVENYEKMRADYVERIKKTYGSDNVISADEAKYVIPGYKGSLANEYHEASSTFAKRLYADMLKEKKGVGNQSVLFTSGGTGVGKTAALKGTIGQKKLNGFPIIYDTNLVGDGATKKVRDAIESGYKVQIAYVHRDPILSFTEGVIPRARIQDRVVSIEEHVERHSQALAKVLELQKEFGDKVDVQFIDNTGARDAVKVSELDNLPKYDYNKDELSKTLYDELQKAEDSGKISKEHAAATRGTRTGRRLEDGAGKGRGGSGAGERAARSAEQRIKKARFTKEAKKSPELDYSLREMLDPKPYDRVTNKETAENAAARVAADPEEATRFVLTEKDPSAEHTAVGIELLRNLQAQKKYEEAAKMADHLADRLVKSGQHIQAAKLLARLSPEGVFAQAQNTIRAVNKELVAKGKPEIKMGDEFADKITDLAKQREKSPDELVKEELSWEIGSMLASLKRVTIGEKLSMLQTIMQLLNPKTLLARNPIGNEIFYRTERLSKMLATPIDWSKTAITGKDRAITFRSVKQGEYWRNFLRGVRAGWRGSIPNALPSQLDVGRQVFKSKYNPFHWAEKLLGASLRGFDFAAYSRAKNQTIGELAYLRALNEGKRGKAAIEAAKGYAETADDNLLKIADDYGRYVTFQDKNFFSSGLSKVKKGLNLNLNFGLGDLALKYPRTPGALLMRGIEYSPAGFVRSAYILSKPFFKGGKVDDREVLQSLSRAIVGTLGFTGLGFYLADKGIITGAPEEDPDLRALERRSGTGQYKVNLSALKRWVMSGFDDSEAELREGDTMYSYDWAQPVAISLSIGANMNEAVDNDGIEAAGLATTALESFKGGVNTLIEQPLVSGIVRIFKFGDVLGGVSETIKSLPASFIPTLSNQINQWIDNTARSTYDPSYIAQAINYAKRKIPGFAQTLHPQVDQFGKDAETFQGNSNNLFNVFFNPGFVSKYQTDPETRLVFDVIEATGETNVAPRLAPKSVVIDGEKRELSAEEYEKFQRSIGTKTLEAFGAFATSDAFMDLSDERKADLMAQTLSDIGKEAKSEIFDSGSPPTITYKDRLNYLEIQDLARSGQEDLAAQRIDSMSDDEYERYKSVRSSERSRNTSTLRSLLQSNPTDAVQFVRDQPPSEQERLLDVMTDEEYETYQEGKTQSYRNTGKSHAHQAIGDGTFDDPKDDPSFFQKLSIDGKKSKWVEGVADFVLDKTTLFSELAKGELRDPNYKEAHLYRGNNGEYRVKGSEIHNLSHAILPDKIADFVTSVGKGLDKPTIVLDSNTKDAEAVMAHEMLHHLYDLSPMGLDIGEENENAELFGGHWLDDWNDAAEEHKILGDIDTHLQKRGYDTDDMYSMGTERFAYLGERALWDGIDVIPQPLRKYYRNVLNFPKKSTFRKGDDIDLGA